MGKLLLFLSFCCLLVLEMVSHMFSADLIMSLTSGAIGFEIGRISLMVLLLILLVTTPPRHAMLRAFTGVIAVATLISVAYLTYNNHMNILDTLSLAATGVTLGIVALEVGSYDTGEVDVVALRQAKIYHQPVPKH